MSKFVQQVEGRRQYRCRACAAKGGPVSDRPALRVVQVYVLVSLSESRCTPVRMSPARLLVHAPPNDWGWGEKVSAPVSDSAATMAVPAEVKHGNGILWRYSAAESEAIWRHSRSYCGEEDPLVAGDDVEAARE